MRTLREVLCTSEVEEIRHNLEQCLGKQKFIDAYPKIENLILNEVKKKNSCIKEKKSLLLFKELFPDVHLELFNKFEKLIFADNEISL